MSLGYCSSYKILQKACRFFYRDIEMYVVIDLFLSARGVSYLFDIQVKTFNPVYEGKDLIGQARTGTGKTFSFAVPLVEKLQSGPEDRRRGRPPKVPLTFSHQCCALWVSAVNQGFKCHETCSRSTVRR